MRVNEREMTLTAFFILILSEILIRCCNEFCNGRVTDGKLARENIVMLVS